MINTSNKTTPTKRQKSSFALGIKLPRIALVTILGVLILGAVVFDTAHEPDAYAQSSGGSVTGYAWSDTIGWISLNGSGYGISVSGSGTLSGYAWSDNIGWVSANSSELSGCPSAPCTATIDSNGAMRGWMKAISGGSSQSGSWDGFISLSGSGYGPARQTDGSLSGYAWGDINVGWVDFRYASTNYQAVPTADLKVRVVGGSTWQDSLTIETTDEIELGWNQTSTTNTTSCEAVPPTYNFTTGSAISGIDSDVDEPIGNTSYTYRLLCYGSGGAQAVDTLVVTTTGGVGAQFVPCSGETSLPSRVPRGEDVNVCWELGTNDPAMCSISAGAATVLSPLSSVTGTVTHPMFGEVTFVLECIGGDGDEMTVQVLPDVQET